MVAVSEISWEEAADPAFGNPARQAWRAAVAAIADKAKATLPECTGRIDRAVALVLAGDVEVLPDGTARVASQSSGTTAYQVVNGHCGCRDFEQAPHALCKHKLAAAITRRALQLLHAEQASQETDVPAPALPLVVIPQAHRFNPEFLVQIQGKTFVRFAGLLQMAHERGLVALTASWTFNDAELSLAHAVARFGDGRVFEEAGDSTPANVGKKVALHWRRVSLTRALARCLRHALNVDLVAVEELSGED